MGIDDEQSNDSEIIKQFKKFSQELTAKQDKYERIVKLSRDITIESKRLIFSVHALARESEGSPDADALTQIRERLQKVVNVNFKKIAIELENEDPYLYHRAYTWGIQEYVEALTFFNYFASSQLVLWEDVINDCTYSIEDEPKPENDLTDTTVREVRLTVPLLDYVLGVQDMTGEAMRLCINALGRGNVAAANSACTFVKYIYASLHLLNPQHAKEFKQKFEVIETSLRKMEYGCYSDKIRKLELEAVQRTTPCSGS